MDLIAISLQLAFYVVTGVAAWRFFRRPGRVELALLAVFGSTAGIFAAGAVAGQLPDLQPLLSRLSVSLLLAQPLFIFWLIHLVKPQPRWLLGLLVVGFGISMAGYLLPAERINAVTLFIAAYFAIGEGLAALVFLRLAQERFGLPRLRLRTASVATMFFASAVVAAALGAVAANGQPNPALPLANLLALGAGLAYLVAFLPPTWLHNVAQRAVAFDLGSRLLTAPAGTEPQLLWATLATTARQLLRAGWVEIVTEGGEQLAAAGEVPPQGMDRPTGALATAPDEPLTHVDIPLVEAPSTAPHLLAQTAGRVLFLEEDIAVLKLLGTMTLRAVEREEAMIRLADAGRELEAAAAVRASEARFRALLEAVPSAVLAVDQAGAIVWSTGPTGQLLGTPVPELSGRRLSDLFVDHGLDLNTSSSDGRVRRAELIAQRADGSTLPVDVAATAFELESRTYELFVLSDASWRATANQLRDRFLGVLSHELRTPITSIYGGTQLLMSRGERLDPDSRREVLSSVASEAERLLRMTENLVVLARVERGAQFFEFRPVALRQLLSSLVARERQLWPGMTIELDVEAGLPLVAADEDYLGQVVRNLISNAGKYAGHLATVHLTATAAEDEVLVRVIDDGPGLTESDAHQIFDLYYRAAETSAAPGAGIGLFICRSLVEAMGGRIWAANADGAGAEFGFSLPQYVEPGEAPRGADVRERAATNTLLG
ncbi:MAG TPA: ATP-binding protein [Candidatus Limnocylindrales bacterium]|nr:ATP-binding protein [Candidatus Limnocylindrales bacterium]